MIRFVIGLFVFAVALCAYIVNLPRGNTNSVQRSVPVIEADVTRGAAPAADPLPTAESISAVVMSQPNLPYPTSSDPLIITVANVLKGLGVPTDSLGPMAARATGPQTRLEMLVLQSLQARLADAEIEAQINDAAFSGSLTVPDVLVRADGRIDAGALLGTIVDQVVIAAGQPAPPVPVLIDQDMLVWQNGQASYRVMDSDSLAGIAERFYGDVTRTDLILVTNPSVLFSADRIKANQVLTIPTL